MSVPSSETTSTAYNKIKWCAPKRQHHPNVTAGIFKFVSKQQCIYIAVICWNTSEARQAPRKLSFHVKNALGRYQMGAW
jgi:hypothetical protein